MKKLFESEDIKILSLDGLNYRTDFTSDAIVEGISTHIPVFYHHYGQQWFVKMGNEVREIRFIKSTFGFRYYEEDGTLSPYWTAIFCYIEGEKEPCVILGRFWQNEDYDHLESASSYANVCGCHTFRSNYPRVFSKERCYAEVGQMNKPDFWRVDLIRRGYTDGVEEYTFDYSRAKQSYPSLDPVVCRPLKKER